MSTVKRRRWVTRDGQHKSAWQVTYKDAAGKRRSKQFDLKKEAEAWLVDTAWDIRRGVHTPDSASITVAQAAEIWLDTVRANGREVTTVAAYEQHVRLHILPICGVIKLSQLTAPMIKGFLDIWLKTRSRAMATRVLRSFKAILAEAQQRGLVAQNAAASVKMPRAPRLKGKLVPPTKDELRRILSSAADAGRLQQAFIELAIFTGMRASELRGLRWSNIDFAGKSVTVRERADAHGEMGAPKSRTSHRTIQLPDRALLSLKAWKLACPASPDNFVFPGRTLKPMSYGAVIDQIMGPVLIAAGVGKVNRNGEILPKYSPHAFRHAAASLWIEEGLNPKRIQTLMGHSSIQMTFDTYGHLIDKAQANARDVNALERALYKDAT